VCYKIDSHLFWTFLNCKLNKLRLKRWQQKRSKSSENIISVKEVSKFTYSLPTIIAFASDQLSQVGKVKGQRRAKQSKAKQSKAKQSKQMNEMSHEHKIKK